MPAADTPGIAPAAARRWPARARLAVFAAGDFAFNLYWQSVMLYLLFYYTEELHLGIAAASLCYAIALVWDGVANLAIGLWMDRAAWRVDHRRTLVVGAVPLGLAFVLAYVPPPAMIAPGGTAALGWVLAGHLVFRTAYAFVNVPYLAMSAQITPVSSDRALVAGGRMLAGTLAAMVVAFGTVPLGSLLTGADRGRAYAAAAAAFAVAGSAILMVVGLTSRVAQTAPVPRQQSVVRSLGHAGRNRAFVSLAAAMMAMVIAVNALDKSVLYYFKYAFGNQRAGQVALGWMMAVSGAAVPAWWLLSRRIGVRSVWFTAIIACLALLALFILGDPRRPFTVQLFLVTIQGVIVGLHFSVWAMLPDCVDYGHARSGVRVEAALFGIAGALQRLAIGLGTALMGQSMAHSGVASGAGFRLSIAIIPLVFFALAGMAMLANPLRRTGRRS